MIIRGSGHFETQRLKKAENKLQRLRKYSYMFMQYVQISIRNLDFSSYSRGILLPQIFMFIQVKIIFLYSVQYN